MDGWMEIGISKERLEESAVALLLGSGLVEGSADGLVEDGLETFLGEGRALEVLHGTDFFGAGCRLVVGNHVQTLGLQLGDHTLVVAQVRFGSDQDDGDTRGMVLNFGPPLRLDVLEGVRRDDGEGDEEDVGLGVGQRAETIVVFLAGGIPQTEVDGLAIHHHVGRVVIEHSGDVLAGEGIGSVRDQEACLADSSVTNNDTLDVLHSSQ
jgi:hypothetical protein